MRSNSRLSAAQVGRGGAREGRCCGASARRREVLLTLQVGSGRQRGPSGHAGCGADLAVDVDVVAASGICAMARSVIAVMVSDGFAPTFAGTAEPSQT